jgi:hypothetical protein
VPITTPVEFRATAGLGTGPKLIYFVVDDARWQWSLAHELHCAGIATARAWVEAL